MKLQRNFSLFWQNVLFPYLNLTSYVNNLTQNVVFKKTSVKIGWLSAKSYWLISLKEKGEPNKATTVIAQSRNTIIISRVKYLRYKYKLIYQSVNTEKTFKSKIKTFFVHKELTDMILVLWKNRRILKLNHRMYYDSMAGTWVVMWVPINVLTILI